MTTYSFYRNILFISLISIVTMGAALGSTPIACDALKALPGIQLEEPTAQELSNDYTLWKQDQSGSFWNLYKQSFPPEEQFSPEEIIENQENPGYTGRVWWMRKENRVIGMAEYVAMPTVGSASVGYLAVSPEFQKGGYGSTLLKCMLEETGRRYLEKAIGLILEVDVPDDLPAHAQEKQRGVVAFYEKRGASILLDDYKMPALSEEEEMRRMYLMIIPQRPEQKLSAELTEEVRQAIYRYSYPGYAVK